MTPKTKAPLTNEQWAEIAHLWEQGTKKPAILAAVKVRIDFTDGARMEFECTPQSQKRAAENRLAEESADLAHRQNP